MEIGQILSSTLELREAFGKMMQIISDKLDMHRGTLVLLDESTGRLRTEAAVGLTPDEIERGKYALGRRHHRERRRDGPAADHPRRAERARLPEPHRPARASDRRRRRSASSACRSRSRAARPGRCRSTSRSSARSSSAATTSSSTSSPPSSRQAIQINRMVMRQKEELLEENAQLRAQVRDRYRFENIIGDSPGDARGLRDGRPGRQQPGDRAAARRDRHRQGDDRQGDPLQLAAQGQAVRPRQLRRADRHAARIASCSAT